MKIFKISIIVLEQVLQGCVWLEFEVFEVQSLFDLVGKDHFNEFLLEKLT